MKGNGQIFACARCQNLYAIQDGFIVKYLNSYFAAQPQPQNFAPGQPSPDPRHFVKLTNGGFVHFHSLVLCADCTPAGAEATSLAEVGVRLED